MWMMRCLCIGNTSANALAPATASQSWITIGESEGRLGGSENVLAPWMEEPKPRSRAVSRATGSWSPVTILTSTPNSLAFWIVVRVSCRGMSSSGTTPMNSQSMCGPSSAEPPLGESEPPAPATKPPGGQSARATPITRKPLRANSSTAAWTAGAHLARSESLQASRTSCGAPFMTMTFRPSQACSEGHASAAPAAAELLADASTKASVRFTTGLNATNMDMSKARNACPRPR
mmetsp:Transcript_169760/g.544810  ORF Transcript_169760/g.544810 Transcript_169760/m.544810 type:complete len:233 (+) Transcript_169760:1414-2112(+)